MLPNHGSAGLALPQNLLAWCVMALLLRFNITRDAALLTRFREWAERFSTVHNNPDVSHSLLMIVRSEGDPSAQALCLNAKARWPDDPRFDCF
ncbi:hypothetical protein [Lelliottia sp.]|uniref:hypothetical protein n=1 Tax=Lelliottia sp. TaxID=1898429 RepID=UPI00388DA340